MVSPSQSTSSSLSKQGANAGWPWVPLLACPAVPSTNPANTLLGKPAVAPSLARLALALLMLVAVGCGRQGPTLLPVSGVVTLDGRPVAEAGLIFTPVEEGPVASGSTDAQGRFQLRTVNEFGAVAGEHLVTVTKQETTGLGDFGAVGPEGVKTIWHVPEKYSNRKTSGLQYTIGPDSDNDTVRIELSSK